MNVQEGELNLAIKQFKNEQIMQLVYHALQTRDKITKEIIWETYVYFRKELLKPLDNNTNKLKPIQNE